jgi:hypothetical protein
VDQLLPPQLRRAEPTAADLKLLRGVSAALIESKAILPPGPKVKTFI